MTDPTDLELQAYVDDQLDLDERFAIEAHLASHPAQAAQVMHDLGTRTGLRLLARSEAATPPVLAEHAAALAQARPPRRWRAVAMGAGAMAATILAGLFLIDRPPSYVDMAVESHRVAVMRAHMASQIEAPALDAHEIRASTRIELPPLPAGWQVTDTQIFPTRDGPAVLVAARTADGRIVSIFALRERSGAPRRPDAVREGGQSVAYWRRGDMSYALTGDGDPHLIDQIAESVARYAS